MKTLVLGAEHTTGISDKGKGRPYDICRAYITTRSDGWSNDHGSSRACGYRPVEQKITPECFQALGKISFPAFVEFETSHEPGRNGLQVVLTGVVTAKSIV